MKIVYVASFSLTEKASGIGQYVVDVSRNMAKLGHEVAVLTYGDETNMRKVGDVTYVDVESFHYPPVRIARMSKNNQKQIDKFLKDFNPDLVHVNLFSQIDFYVSNWAKENGVLLTYTTHLLPSALMSFGGFGKGVQNILNSKFVLGLLGKLYTGFDFLIAPNKIAKQDIVNLEIKVPTVVVNNGFNGEVLERGRVYADDPKKKLLYVGGGHPRKNQLFLIKALSYLDESYELNLIGRFYDEKYLKEIQEYLSSNNITNVNFLGLIKHDKVIDEMFKSDMFVSASTVEVQSLVVLEALATGLPIVALSNETTSELIGDKNGRCLDVKSSAEQFAMSIKEIAEISDDEYKVLSQGARDSVRNMTWEGSTKKLESIYVDYVKEYKSRKSGVLKLLSNLFIFISTITFLKVKSGNR